MEMSANMISEENIPVVVFLGIIIFAGILGNSVVCYVYIFKLKSSTINVFIIGLAVTDLINCCIPTPLDIAALIHKFAFTSNHWLCVVLRVSNLVLISVSNYLLLAIAIERYLKVCRPLKRQMSQRTAKGVIIACCGMSVLQTLPTCVLYGSKTLPPDNSNFTLWSELTCPISDEYAGTLFESINNSYFAVVFFALTVALFVLYLLMWRRVSKQATARKGLVGYKMELQMTNTTPSQSTDTDQAETQLPPDQKKVPDVVMNFDKTGRKSKSVTDLRSTAGKKMTCMLFVITLVFILSFFPCIGVAVLLVVNKDFLKDATVFEYVTYHILSRSLYIQTVSNPIIYTIYNKQFRHHVKRLVKRRTRNDL